MAEKIMIIGYGSTGKYVLDMATKLPAFSGCTFSVISRTPKEEAEKRINITRVSTGIFGSFPQIKYFESDIRHIARMSELIKNVSPDIIAYTGRYMKGFKYGEFSYPNEIGYGAWTPMAIVLVEKVMRAIQQSGVKTKVINTSYGDAVSPALASIGLAPYTSAGNLNHLVPRMKLAFAEVTGDKPEQVDVTFAGSHYANTYISREGTPKGSPYLLKITGKSGGCVEDARIFEKCALSTLSGPERNWMIASDVVMLMQLMLDKSGTKRKIHAPGPFGLIGGYPLVFQNGEMRLDTSDFSAEEMERVNQESLRCDGIDTIDENGITFTDTLIRKMKEVFGLDYPRTISISDCEPFSRQIAQTLSAFKQSGCTRGERNV